MSKNISFTKKAQLSLILSFLLLFTLIIELIYLQNIKSMDQEILNKKQIFLSYVGLPDLAFANENSYIRHRSLANIFEVYSCDPSLREYSNTTFTINHKEMN